VPVRLYTDVHIPQAVIDGLLHRGVAMMTSQTDQTTRWADDRLLARATELESLLVTQDADLLAIAHDWQQNGITFHGVAYSHQLSVSIGDLVTDLALIAECCSPEELRNQVVYLPL